jgi:hypothetical protein
MYVARLAVASNAAHVRTIVDQMRELPHLSVNRASDIVECQVRICTTDGTTFALEKVTKETLCSSDDLSASRE